MSRIVDIFDASTEDTQYVEEDVTPHKEVTLEDLPLRTKNLSAIPRTINLVTLTL